MHWAEQVDPHHLGDAAGIMAIRLVHLGFKKGFGVPRLDAHDREPG